MIRRLAVPATLEDNDAVRLLEWHASPGETLPAGALVVELETHKALIEVRAGAAATLRERCYAEGEWAPLGATLALFSDDPAETLDAAAVDLAADFTIG